MADWFIATEGVKVVKDSASLWPQIITAASAAGAALCGVWLTHHFAREREERASAERRDHELKLIEDKRQQELTFIATELVFTLEQFAERCAGVATDDGEPNNDQGEHEPTVKEPELDMSGITADWQVLPPLILYRIRELPILRNEASRYIAGTYEYDDNPPFYRDTFRERQYQYARLGLKAIILSRRLRRLARFPETRLDATRWSAQPVLWEVWRRERKQRASDHIEPIMLEP